MAFSEAVAINPKRALPKAGSAPFLDMASLPLHGAPVRVSETRAVTSGGAKFQVGDTLFARITPCAENGKLGFVEAVANGEVAQGSTEFIVMGAREGITVPEYVRWLAGWGNIRDHAIGLMEGTSGRQRVPVWAFDEIEVPVPPLGEQLRIANVLWSADEAIAAAEMAARQSEAVFTALLDVAFLTGEPTDLGDICSLIYRYPGFYGFDQCKEGVPVIRGEHLRAGRISTEWSDFYFVDPAFSARFPRTILGLDDVVMSVRGTVGTTAIVEASHVGSQISPNLIRLVADPAKIMPPLLYYAVQSAVAHMRRTIVNAQALPAINAGDIKRVEIALPPIADQPALLEQLNWAATVSAKAIAAAEQARLIKSTIMSDLLSGRVRVPA